MRALSVFSGGLDSILAAEVIRAQDIEVLALYFETPFFPSAKARKSAAAINLPIKVIDIFEDHIEIVKKPRHGYGENMNPCIDCHTLMFSKAGEMLEKEGADFVITGEVLGQRPMSQNRGSLARIASESGYDGLILRPLSAKLLPATIPEQKGWVNREALMDWSGRTRKPQMALAKDLNIKDYPSPAGGCLLTDGIFSRRLRDLFHTESHLDRRDIELLKLGRLFRLGPRTRLIVGRNRKENQAIQSLSTGDDVLLRTVSVPGPTVLVLGEFNDEWLGLAAAITVSYSDADDDDMTEVRMTGKGMDRVFPSKGRGKDSFKGYMI
jgi:tRNA-specific 2-thiouridylase